MESEEVSGGYNPYFKYSDDELIRFAQLRATSNLEVELAARLSDALDSVAELQQELAQWNPWCRMRGQQHDA